jgi:plastocyanin
MALSRRTPGGSSTGSAAAAKSAAASAHQVMIMNYAFSPASLAIAAGDTVTWTNEDSAPHTVTVTNGPKKFDSGTLQKGQSFSYAFTAAGTYSY